MRGEGFYPKPTWMHRNKEAPQSFASLTTLLITGQIESNYDETVDSFDEMNLKSELLRGEYLLPRDRSPSWRSNY